MSDPESEAPPDPAPEPPPAPEPEPPPPPPPPQPVRHSHALIRDATGEVIEFGQTVLDVGMEPPALLLDPGTTRIAITDQQYAQVRTGRPHRLVEGQLVPFTPEVPLSRLQTAALEHIDAAAERARQAFITPGAGQALEYQATQAEALVVLAGGVEPDPEDAPWLAAERDALATVEVTVTLLEVAQQVQALQAQWGYAGAAIKRIRREAKMKVEAATTPEQILAIRAGLTWPSPG